MHAAAAIVLSAALPLNLEPPQTDINTCSTGLHSEQARQDSLILILNINGSTKLLFSFFIY
jgi:hypothetical protein